MNHGEFAIYIFEDLYFYMGIYVIIVIAYIYMYRNICWSLFDPMALSISNMAGGAFCVFFLAYQNSLDYKYRLSFILTELALLVGFYISKYMPRFTFRFKNDSLKFSNRSISKFDVFSWVIGVIYITSELVSLKTIGIVLLDSDVNHVSAFGEHGILMAFILSYRTLVTVVLFYKKIVLNWAWSKFDIFCLVLVVFGVLTSGSKSSILTFLFTYFIVRYPLVKRGYLQQIKLSPLLIVILMAFPLVIMIINTGSDTITSLQLLYVRLLASGDVFLLGYNDDVMSTIQEKSFLKYAFYPGWGTILKNLGVNIVPPEVIGVDIFDYHYGIRNSGANARHNYLGLHFLGFYGSIIFSFLVGLVVGYIRNVFKHSDPYNTHFLYYTLLVILAYFFPLLIDDVGFFANFTFWRVFFLLTSYFISYILFELIKMMPSKTLVLN